MYALARAANDAVPSCSMNNLSSWSAMSAFHDSCISVITHSKLQTVFVVSLGMGIMQRRQGRRAEVRI